MERQIAHRRNKLLHYEFLQAGKILHRWFDKIVNEVRNGNYYAELFFSGTPQSEAYSTSVLEPLFGFSFDGLVSQVDYDHSKLIWVCTKGLESGRHPKDRRTFEKYIKEECDAVKAQYLGGHTDCLQATDQVLGYPDGRSRYCNFCPVSVAYSFLRFSLARPSWPLPFTLCPSLADYGRFIAKSNFYNWLFESRRKFIRYIFLYYLGHLEESLSRRKSIYLFGRGGGNFDRTLWCNGLGFMFRSNYGLRHRCQSCQEMDRIPALAREGGSSRIALIFPDDADCPIPYINFTEGGGLIF
ncbi:hypothetical protein [Pseudomonas cavernae]|uniref:hypothetical protein n=1 Tax=Pseudomonas cavernae TaxID=2320867 RepID=UPI0013C435AC|nr:hypothetical protein [Pseudomonas cavernae]